MVLLAKKARRDAAQAASTSQEGRSAKQKTKQTAKGLTYVERQELELLPDKIEGLECQLEEVNTLLGSPEAYGNAEVDIAVLRQRMQTLEEELSLSLERWEELSEKELS